MILETMPKTLNRIMQSSYPVKKVPEWYIDFDRVTLEGSQLLRLGAPETYNDVPELDSQLRITPKSLREAGSPSDSTAIR